MESNFFFATQCGIKRLNEISRVWPYLKQNNQQGKLRTSQQSMKFEYSDRYINYPTCKSNGKLIVIDTLKCMGRCHEAVATLRYASRE
jgi:hypothetical protein